MTINIKYICLVTVFTLCALAFSGCSGEYDLADDMDSPIVTSPAGGEMNVDSVKDASSVDNEKPKDHPGAGEVKSHPGAEENKPKDNKLPQKHPGAGEKKK